MACVFLRNSNLIVRDVDNQLFVIDEPGGQIHHLNETASAIWRLLEEPQSANDIIRTFRFLYPDENAAHIKRGLRDALSDLSDRDVLLRRRKREM
jgi:hypothetical protein